MVQRARFDAPRPFKIAIPQDRLDRAQKLVELTDLAPFYANALDGAETDVDEDCTYGLSVPRIRALLEHLQSGKFDWRAHEAKLQAMGEHSIVHVDGIEGADYALDVHVVVARSSKADATPLLLIHGWPGSIYEFHKIVPILQRNYHVVMPSMPGYAFSSSPRKAAEHDVPLTATICAIAFEAVMRAVGFTGRFVVQGGDWGSHLSRRVAQCFPDRVAAIHTNMFMNVAPKDASSYADWEQRGAQRAADFAERGVGYSGMQSTVPYTLGAVLQASPVATVIYIGEKFYRWTGPDTHPSVDEVVANGMLYYLTGSLTSSFWLYYNRRVNVEREAKEVAEMVIDAPARIGMGDHEIRWPPRDVAEKVFTKLRSYKLLESCGHFAAFERPELLAADMDALFLSDEVQSALRS